MTTSRNTRQRSVILKILEGSQNPVSAPAILAAAQKLSPSLNKTTVYRTLERLVDERLAEAIMLKEGVVHYELRHPSACGHHHHHFVCSDCERIFCIDGCASSFEVLLPRGFKLQSHEITLRGLCKGCA